MMWRARSPCPRGGQRGRVARAASLSPCAHRPRRGPAPGEAAAHMGHQRAAGSVPPRTTPARGVPAAS